jgi:death-on-curing protein
LPVEPLWLDLEFIEYAHTEQLELFGGEHGVLDIGLVDSALNAPRHTFHYKDEDDLLVLAVELGVGIARNHGYIDGNKRTGVVAMLTFLAINGYAIDMRNDRTLGRLFERVIERKMEEADLVAMLYDRLEELD